MADIEYFASEDNENDFNSFLLAFVVTYFYIIVEKSIEKGISKRKWYKINSWPLCLESPSDALLKCTLMFSHFGFFSYLENMK